MAKKQLISVTEDTDALVRKYHTDTGVAISTVYELGALFLLDYLGGQDGDGKSESAEVTTGGAGEPDAGGGHASLDRFVSGEAIEGLRARPMVYPEIEGRTE